MELKDISTALKIFEEATIKQTEASEMGDYKMGNTYYDQIQSVGIFLKNENALSTLLQYLTHSNIGLKLWAAYFLLPLHEEKSIQALEDIINESGIHSLTAQTTLNEWKKGKL